MQYDFPNQLSGEERGPTVCESCMGALAACLTQTIVAHATSRGIHIDSIDIDVKGDVDMRGWTGISNDLRPGAQQFRKKKWFSLAFDTLTNGTSVILVNS